ncbi:MAG: hypothetical protein A2289_15265 [Deltaproteobacteria bacterium RIFOXYA12_FULL_58_15]|nr:MAG: hypothetical protein A2289_15265 [Deltaproteobacteria bacterium RIFOXYA12_FULL_58_15]OGR10247.1 MAG: hypothetical protein A2341_22065 [Deltaproteobacteria bacterium RIFOXYB12_FULL_58_9]
MTHSSQSGNPPPVPEPKSRVTEQEIDKSDAIKVTIRTSESGWLARLARTYRERQSILLIDDAEVGVDPSTQTLLEMGKRAGLRREEWFAVLVSLGLLGAGVAMIFAAIVDPEPTSKLGLLVAGGTICAIGGGFSAIRILTRETPPDVQLSPRGIQIRWH